MAKKAVSVTLDESNLVWLKGLTERSGARSLSETIDRLIATARESGNAAAKATRSVVGTIDIAAADPNLDHADLVLGQLFAKSLSRPMLVRETRSSYGGRRRRG
jgi:hypothetical protein